MRLPTRAVLVKELIESNKQFTTDERMRLCSKWGCTMKDLIIAEYNVGKADPEAVHKYLVKKELI